MDRTTKINCLLVLLTVFSCSLSTFNYIRCNELKAEQESFYPASKPISTQEVGTTDLFKNIEEIKKMIREVYSILDKRLKDIDKCRCSDNVSQGNADGSKDPKGNTRDIPRGPPRMKEKKLDINATKGENAIFICQFYGNPLPNITWKSNILNSEVNQSIDWELSVVTSKLHARNLEWRDRGVVQCSARNILGTEYGVGTLLLLAPPKIIISQNTVIGMADRPVTFPHCRVQSDPKYNVTWERGFPGLPENRTGNVDGILRISKLKKQDQGYYKCIAKNYLGTDAKYIFLHVSELKFTKKPYYSIYRSNGSALLTCGANGSAGLEVKWIQCILEVGELGRDWFCDLNNGKHLSSVKENKSKYEMVISTKVNQSGLYRCVVYDNITTIGTYTMVRIFIFSLNSNLLNDSQVSTLGQWIADREYNSTYKLCWSGSKHGFNSSIFGSRCAGKNNTITIIKIDNDTVVGGFSDEPWTLDENSQASNIEKYCGDYIRSPGIYNVSLKSLSSCKVNFQLGGLSTIEIVTAYFKDKYCRDNYFKVKDTSKDYSERFCVSDVGKGKLITLGNGSGTMKYHLRIFYRDNRYRRIFPIMIRIVKYQYSSLSFIYALQPTKIILPVEDKEKAICDLGNFGVCFGRMDLLYHEKSITISSINSYSRSFGHIGADPFKRGKYSVEDIEVHYKV